MKSTPLLQALHRRLVRLSGFQGVPLEALALLPTTGLAHDHVRVGGMGVLLRVPKQSQLGLPASDNLTYQAACFERCGPGGHVPGLRAVLLPDETVPMGALVVDEIKGRPPMLPADLPAIIRALASIHSLPIPPSPAGRRPLRDHADPVGETLREVTRHAAHLDAAGLRPEARRAIDGELAWAAEFARRDTRPPITLISFDAHPGNYLVTDTGTAVLVDLEKARYGAAGFDLAHATLYTSTTWDVACHAVLGTADLAAAYEHWLNAVPTALARASLPWLLPLRRVMWLWSVTWSAKWRVESKAEAKPLKHQASDAEDWSADLSDAALVDHVANRVADFLDPVTIAAIRSEWLDANPLTDLLPSGG
ncbi:aminoglycoside phosphotransferase [Skermanella stibiiresistens SB22]|uniref:Aminoglycoside phosphotransferase n=1 Tax=Skermanella stibiiresistens SB22 TaxID=1385369 RepID=W9H3V8_9PROT|nr:aminoglycoside phosphotransferase family protein [Skermanella stibiiresistens]EWY38453.1 aminoglycoside phosphotransferase [Skermanella stibiiresistens SB22]